MPKFCWEVSDGYVGGPRYQYTKISQELLDQCPSDSERDEFIDDCIQNDFDAKIMWKRVKENDKP